MPVAVTHPVFYVSGGTLRPDAPSYVERQADTDLYDGLQRGEFCYVLTSRQMGKSSLMVRTAARLREEGVHVVVLDLTAVGQNLSPEQWYDGLLGRLARQLDLEDELESFWEEHERFGPLQRWIAALQDVVLRHCRGRVVIFVDEIDAVRSLPFSADEFFAAIRECYTRRAEDAAFHRLTFCLLGVATPSDLIRDTRLTPFNIGRRIDLTDFTEAEAAPLALGLAGSAGVSPASGHAGETPALPAPDAPHLLERILYWTGGHPYLTQRLCQAVAEAVGSRPSPVGSQDGAQPSPTSLPTADCRLPTGLVDRHCEALFLSSSARERDDNLLFVRERLLRSEADLASLLDLYGKVRAGQRVPVDDTSSLIDILRLSGITRVVESSLTVRNRIYERVFNREWVGAHMPDAELRRQRAAFRRGLARAAAVSAVVIAVTVTLAISSVGNAIRAERNAIRAERHRQTADLAAQEARVALKDKGAALQDKEAALQAARLALEAARRAEGRERVQRLVAVAAHRRAEEESLRARRAEREKTDKLWASYLAEARARRGSGRVGQRFQSLAALANAAAIYPTLELRNEAIAAMALLDLKPARYRKGTPFATPSLRKPAGVEHYVWSDRAGNIRLHRTGDDRELLRLRGFGMPAWVFRLSPDRRFLAVKYHREHAIPFRDPILFCLWDLDRREVILKVPNGVDGDAMDFSPDGRWAAAGQLDGTIVFYELPSGGIAKRLSRGPRPTSLRFHPDGRKLAVASLDPPQVEIRDVETGDTVMRLPHAEGVIDVAWRADGRLLAAGCGDFRVYLWDVTARTPSPKHLEGHQAEVWGVLFSPGGELLASHAWDGYTRLWDPEGRRQLLSIPHLPAESGGPYVMWGEVAVGQELRQLYGHSSGGNRPLHVEIRADGRLMASSSDGGVRLWDIALGKEIAFLPIGLTWSALVLPRSGDLVTSGDAGLLRWPIRRDTAAGGLRIGPPQSLGLPAGLRRAAVSRDERTFAVLHHGRIDVLDGTAPERRVLLTGQPNVSTVTISPDGRWVASGTWKGTGVRVWDAHTGKPVRDLPVEGSAYVCFSPDGRWLVTGGAREYRFWEAGSWRPRHAVPRNRVRDLGGVIAFTRDGKMAAIARTRELVQLIDPSQGRELATLEAPDPRGLNWLCFSPDGSRLAVGCGPYVIQLWDLRLIRKELRAMRLDWNGTPLPPVRAENTVPLRVEVMRREAEALIGAGR